MYEEHLVRVAGEQQEWSCPNHLSWGLAKTQEGPQNKSELPQGYSKLSQMLWPVSEAFLKSQRISSAIMGVYACAPGWTL